MAIRKMFFLRMIGHDNINPVAKSRDPDFHPGKMIDMFLSVSIKQDTRGMYDRWGAFYELLRRKFVTLIVQAFFES